jgi:hypothetical protein
MSDLTTAQLGAINKEIQDLHGIYQKDQRGDTFRLLLTGDTGTGKTYTARTAPKLVHIDSFDPGGTQSIDDLIEAGEILADTRFEQDDPNNPMAFNLWESSFDRRLRMGYFQHINTYYLDSITKMSDAAMNLVLKEKGRPGGVPQQDDYLPQMTKISRMINKISALPCNIVCTAHLDLKEDKVSEALIYRVMITGKLSIRIPLLFSEVYVMTVKETATGTRYAFLTQSTGRYVARTRLGKGGTFDKYEVPDIRALLKKAGKPSHDRNTLPNIIKESTND